MRDKNMRIILALLAAVILSGCYRSIPVIKEAIPCKPPQELLGTCDLPVKIEEGITYADLLQLVQKDREHLATCCHRYEDLVRLINACNEEIEKHNQKIQEINAIIKQR
jgi:hypothetical protein